MKEVLWSSLVASLQSGQCVLVLGPDLPAASVAGDGEAPKSVRDLFCENLAAQLEEEEQKVGEMTLFAVAQQYDDSPAFSTVNLKNLAAAFFRDPKCGPGRLHQALTELPFGVVLTTCHDGLLEKTYRQKDIHVSRYWYHYRGEPRDNQEISGVGSPENPVIYHLFGTFDEPNSLVLTENDLLDFLIHVISGRPKLPDSLRSALRNKTFLFFGFGIKHWYIRVLLKLLVRTLELSGGSVALESLAGLDAREQQQTVLFYKRGTRIEVVDMEALEFLDELSARLSAAGGYLGPGKAAGRRATVFISYERSDADDARRLYEALPKDKLDPWLDTQYLAGGDDWNAELEQRIRVSDFVLVLNSKNLVEKRIGYVNKEIDAVLDRQKYFQAGTKFIVPLQLGGIRPEDGLAELGKFQQMPLRQASFDDDVQDIARLLIRDFQLRSR